MSDSFTDSLLEKLSLCSLFLSSSKYNSSWRDCSFALYISTNKHTWYIPFVPYFYLVTNILTWYWRCCPIVPYLNLVTDILTWRLSPKFHLVANNYDYMVLDGLSLCMVNKMVNVKYSKLLFYVLSHYAISHLKCTI